MDRIKKVVVVPFEMERQLYNKSGPQKNAVKKAAKKAVPAKKKESKVKEPVKAKWSKIK